MGYTLAQVLRDVHTDQYVANIHNSSLTVAQVRSRDPATAMHRALPPPSKLVSRLCAETPRLSPLLSFALHPGAGDGAGAAGRAPGVAAAPAGCEPNAVPCIWHHGGGGARDAGTAAGGALPYPAQPPPAHAHAHLSRYGSPPTCLALTDPSCLPCACAKAC
eukprot:361082-Chlamydomonas_euryale.AAC.18